MYTILGAGGVIANEFSNVLFQNKTPFTLVSRKARSVNGGLTLATDLTSRNQTDEALRGATIALLCPGLKYDLKVWEKHWPLIMNNTIDSCKRHGVKLIFFDNVYMLGHVDEKMTEETPHNPNSKKGEVREKIVTQLMNEVRAGNITAMVARSADFYGPGCKTSFLNSEVFDRMANGKRARWLVNDEALHSFSFTPDCARALWILSNSPKAWNQVWNLPTASPPLTGKQIISMAAEIFGVFSKHSVISKGTVDFLGIFMKIMKEMKEMLYQFESDYIFDSSKFEKAFDFKPTSYRAGFEIVAASYKKK